MNRVERKGEYPVPTDARLAHCRSCGAEIYWTMTGSGRRMPLSVATVEEDEDGQYALVHWADCPHAEEHRGQGAAFSQDATTYPLTMVFPRGALVPVFCAYEHQWENGEMTVTFADRGQLRECVFVSQLARELGLTGWVVERGDVTRIDMVLARDG